MKRTNDSLRELIEDYSKDLNNIDIIRKIEEADVSNVHYIPKLDTISSFGTLKS